MNKPANALLDNPLFCNWPDGLIAVGDNGKIIALSHSAIRILGWSYEDCYNQSPHEVLCAQDREHAHTEDECHFSHLAADDEVRSSLWKKRDGNYISVDYRMIDIKLEHCACLISFLDNSERIHNQAEMQKFTEYSEKSPSPIAEFDQYGQLLFGNTIMNELLHEYDFNDMGHANFLPENIADICQNVVANKDSEQASIATCEYCVKGRYYNWHFQPLESDDEVTVMGYAFDISEQKAAQALAEERKNQSRKEFFAKMVHELRTPLNAIVGFSNILLSRIGNKLDERELDRLKAIKNAGLQLNDLVTDTLDFSKIESGKMTLDISEFPISDICEDVHEQMATLAKQKNLSYQYKSFTEKPICSDRTKVRQIIVNLVSNAVKYTLEGKVNLMLSETVDPELGDCFQIVVLDTGIGIPQEKIPKLFTSFEQVESEETRDIQGTGLGLALVKDLVCLLGGKINVTSSEGEGSSFEVLLPYSASLAGEEVHY